MVRLRRFVGTIVLLLLSGGGCTHQYASLGVVSRASAGAQSTGRPARGSDCSAFSKGRIDDAFDEAVAQGGGNALVNVRVKNKFYFLWHCWVVEGTGAVVK